MLPDLGEVRKLLGDRSRQMSELITTMDNRFKSADAKMDTIIGLLRSSPPAVSIPTACPSPCPSPCLTRALPGTVSDVNVM